MHALESAFCCFSYVLKHMETIRNLDGFWCPIPCSTGKLARAISAHYENTGMAFEPEGKGIRCPLGKEIYWTMRSQIDQDSSIRPAPFEGEVIDSQEVGSFGHRDLD